MQIGRIAYIPTPPRRVADLEEIPTTRNHPVLDAILRKRALYTLNTAYKDAS